MHFTFSMNLPFRKFFHNTMYTSDLYPCGQFETSPHTHKTKITIHLSGVNRISIYPAPVWTERDENADEEIDSISFILQSKRWHNHRFSVQCSRGKTIQFSIDSCIQRSNGCSFMHLFCQLFSEQPDFASFSFDLSCFCTWHLR